MRPDAPSHLDAYLCSDVDVLLESLCGRIDELEADVRSAQVRHAAAVAKLDELTSVERQLGRKLLLAGTELASIRNRAEVEAARIVDEAEAHAAEITERGDAATGQLRELTNALLSEATDSESPDSPSSGGLVDLSEEQEEPPAERGAPEPVRADDRFAQSFEAFLAALRTPAFDDPAFGPASSSL